MATTKGPPITCPITPVQSQDPSKQRCLWHFNSAKWEDLRQYYSDFPRDDYCFHVRDPSFCAECITEVIISGMKLYIPHTFSNTKAKSLGLTLLVLVLSIERWLTSGTVAIHLLKLMPYIFLPVIMPNLFYRKCQSFQF